MSEKPPAAEAKPGLWEKLWPRVLSLLQAGLGTFIVVYEVLSGGQRLYLIAFAFLAVSGAPLTAIALRVLMRSGPK